MGLSLLSYSLKVNSINSSRKHFLSVFYVPNTVKDIRKWRWRFHPDLRQLIVCLFFCSMIHIIIENSAGFSFGRACKHWEWITPKVLLFRCNFQNIVKSVRDFTAKETHQHYAPADSHQLCLYGHRSVTWLLFFFANNARFFKLAMYQVSGHKLWPFLSQASGPHPLCLQVI